MHASLVLTIVLCIIAAIFVVAGMSPVLEERRCCASVPVEDFPREDDVSSSSSSSSCK